VMFIKPINELAGKNIESYFQASPAGYQVQIRTENVHSEEKEDLLKSDNDSQFITIKEKGLQKEVGELKISNQVPEITTVPNQVMTEPPRQGSNDTLWYQYEYQVWSEPAGYQTVYFWVPISGSENSVSPPAPQDLPIPGYAY